MWRYEQPLGAGGGGGLSDVVDDLTPQLGGSLDVNGKSIVSVSAGDIAITPDTTGNVVLDGLNWPQADGAANQAIVTNAGGQLSFATVLLNVVDDLSPQLGGSLDVNGKSIVSVSAGDIAITPDTTGNVVLDGLNWPQADGAANQAIVTNAGGQLSFATVLLNVVDDLSPQLGASLDVNGKSIVSVSAGDIAITPDTTGNVVLDGLNWPQADGSTDQVLKTNGSAQLSWGPAGGPPAETFENDNASAMVIGEAAYVQADGNMNKARADTAAFSRVDGLVQDTSISSGADGKIQLDGVLTATTTQWDAVAGTTGGLTPGAIYYLDPDTRGALTETAPTDPGEYVAKIGVALSTTKMNIDIEPTILL